MKYYYHSYFQTLQLSVGYSSTLYLLVTIASFELKTASRIRVRDNLPVCVYQFLLEAAEKNAHFPS